MPKKFLFVVVCLLTLINVSILGCSYIQSPHPTSNVHGISSTTTLPNSTTTSIVQYSATIITTYDYGNSSERLAILFNNNIASYSKYSCVVRTHNPDGSFLSEYNVTSNFIAPNSHSIYFLNIPLSNAQGITIVNLQRIGVPIDQEPRFIKLLLNNLTISTINGNLVLSCKMINTGYEDTGTGTQGNGYVPNNISIQILKAVTDGSFALISNPDFHNLSLPAGEFTNINIPIWDNITIVQDAQDAFIKNSNNSNVINPNASNPIIDGEINIIAYYLGGYW